MARLLLIRHGTTKLQATDRFWGKTDIPLSAAGIKEIKKLKARLAKEKIDACYSSTLSRARSTAEIICEGRKVKTVACEELRECDFGDIEGLGFKEIEQRYPDIARKLANGTAVNFPGGESLKQLDSRVKKFIKRLETIKPNDTVAIVSHGGPLRLLICHLLGISVKHWQQFNINRASLSIIETYPQMAFLSLLNDTSHLK
ncbi:MAG: histidine phosphatase family protein [Dehalococcoidales bacterium]|nr:histidine phosphatase family protein [Dehalococcoidales bacterium]